MKLMKPYRPSLITLVSVAASVGSVLGPGQASAQFGFVGPVSPTGPIMRPLGIQYPTHVSGLSTPFFVVSPRGIRPGYLGPNGPYAAPTNSNEAMLYPNGGQVGSVGNMSLFAPFNAPASLVDPSQADPVIQNAAGVPGQTYNGRIPRTSDTSCFILARIDKENRLVVKWSGDPRAVASIRFALLDKDHKVLKEERVNRLPAEARLAITSKTSYYRVYIEYVNGTVTNVVSPL